MNTIEYNHIADQAALATVVGVLVEVPVMLTLVRIANNTRHWLRQTDERRI